MTELHPGDQLDHYTIDRLVARSVMAWIYRAKDARTGDVVAIKVPLPEVEADPVLYDRFQREATIGLRMDHPNVLRVLPNEGASELYLVMQWVEGTLLRNVLQQGRLSARRAVHITLEICAALTYIHQQGVVHRDLKPENIMIGPGSGAGDPDHVTLIDFGIAVHAGARRLTFAKFSQTMGTADYISPEQVRGHRGDERSDLYELGVMLYEMLTGSVPFTGANPFTVMNDRLVNSFIPPRQLEPSIPAALEEVIYRALEREPKNRYRTAQEFAHDLRHPEELADVSRAEATMVSAPRRSVQARAVVKYALLALIPLVLFALLLVAAKYR